MDIVETFEDDPMHRTEQQSREFAAAKKILNLHFNYDIEKTRCSNKADPKASDKTSALVVKVDTPCPGCGRAPVTPAKKFEGFSEDILPTIGMDVRLTTNFHEFHDAKRGPLCPNEIGEVMRVGPSILGLGARCLVRAQSGAVWWYDICSVTEAVSDDLIVGAAGSLVSAEAPLLPLDGTVSGETNGNACIAMHEKRLHLLPEGTLSVEHHDENACIQMDKGGSDLPSEVMLSVETHGNSCAQLVVKGLNCLKQTEWQSQEAIGGEVSSEAAPLQPGVKTAAESLSLSKSSRANASSVMQLSVSELQARDQFTCRKDTGRDDAVHESMALPLPQPSKNNRRRTTCSVYMSLGSQRRTSKSAVGPSARRRLGKGTQYVDAVVIARGELATGGEQPASNSLNCKSVYAVSKKTLDSERAAGPNVTLDSETAAGPHATNACGSASVQAGVREGGISSMVSEAPVAREE